ncbi:putative methanogenesis marker protein 8 [Methanosarcina sp. Kolksee]|nr:putative methanogenesis marker protein 8 [Methanosarcina sp. Kolksee]
MPVIEGIIMPHIMEIMGKTRVVVKDGKVIEVGEAELEWCPLIDKLSGVQKITSEEVKKNVEFKIKEYGMFTAKRHLLGHDTFVAFGASEIMMSGLRSGFLDTTVTACDGAGTVISNNPELVQGIGGRMSGLVETEPIEDVINGIQKLGGIVLDTKTASIDPVGGVKKAAELGYKKIAVTTADSKTAKNLREIETELGLGLIVIAVHVTGVSKEEAQGLLENSDLVISCASKYIRELAKPIVQVAAAIPLFALTKKGKKLVIERERDIESPILITTTELPVVPKHKQPRDLK